ncbi:hypothetical protein [Nesterenkonia sandarakina]|uniref:Glycosyl transferase family 2 n=1 Tax=Nesterenkonia sandarakina TaxID=272918 RepID=A0A2T0YSW9_9MICC|nr:hypothetical protein [Nesterenkonia sandarakina]PRZ18893.1 hypothetical protein BCL67_101201 [Nesterenkonia sandarakina]
MSTLRRPLGAPQVTVLAVVGDDGAWMDESILSVLSQRGCEVELVLLDGGASPSVWDRCLSHADADPRVSCVAAAATVGSTADQWRVGRDASHGEFLLFLTLRDLLAPDALVVLYAAAVREAAQCAVGRHLVTTSQATTSMDIAWKHVPVNDSHGATNAVHEPGLLGVRRTRAALLKAETVEQLDLIPGEGLLDAHGTVTVSLLLQLSRVAALDAVTSIRRSNASDSWEDQVTTLLESENATADLLLDTGSVELWKGFWRGSLDAHLRPVLTDVVTRAAGATVSPELRRQIRNFLLRRDADEWQRLQPRLRAAFSLLAEGDADLVPVVWRLWDAREGENSVQDLVRRARLLDRLARSRFVDELALSRYYAELLIRPAAQLDLDDPTILELADALRVQRNGDRLSVEIRDPSSRELALHEALICSDPTLFNPPFPLPETLTCYSVMPVQGRLELLLLVPAGVVLDADVVFAAEESTDVHGSVTRRPESGHWVLASAIEDFEPDADYSVSVQISGPKARGVASLELIHGAERSIQTDAEHLTIAADQASRSLTVRRRVMEKRRMLSKKPRLSVPEADGRGARDAA